MNISTLVKKVPQVVAVLLAAAVAATKNIQQQLSVACCALLSSTVQAHEADSPHHSEPWLINIGLANFIERERNTGIELITSGERAIGEDKITLKAEFDVITGATPNGATASDVPQTFTQASGNGTYTVKANDLPTDDTHMDTRMGLSVAYNSVINSDARVDYSARISMEFDYLSLGAGINLQHDFNQHNTTLMFGYDYEYNRVHPVGNIPTPLASMQPPNAIQPRGNASKTKRVDGFSVGINQIITAQSFIQLKYSLSNASGYLTDPYKLLSVIESGSGQTLDYLYEKRPRHRQMQSIYLSNKTFLSNDVLDLSYRYYWDEWDIKSSTIDFRYRRQLPERQYLQPHLRYYTQTAANFFRHSLPDNINTPNFASADFRIAKFDAYTIGLKYGKQTLSNSEHSISVEYYTQIGNNHPGNAIGLQKKQDLFPTLQTLVLFYNYTFNW